MKSISKIFITLLISIFVGVCNNAFAQNIDNNRMNRDINIMENILQEMFKTYVKTSAGSSSFSFGSINSIRGTYLPDYGIIFSVPGAQRRFITVNKDENVGIYSYVFQYSDDSDDNSKVTKESITLRIKEFLREYGSTIGQLKDDDKMMVIYNSNTHSSAVTYFNSFGMKKLSEKLPTISVVVNKGDLQKYRSGSISKSELDERFSVSVVEDDKKEKLDLKVMGNIFETALDDSGEDSFHLRGDVDYLMLDNFGAVFSFRADYGSSVHLMGNFNVKTMNTIRAKLTQVDPDSAAVTKVRERAQKIKEEQEKRHQAEKEAYQKLLGNVKEYLVDYGRTLSSVSSDQHILISATVSSRVDDIPERVDFQIKKSVLEAMDKGSMSRDEAMNQITIREY